MSTIATLTIDLVGQSAKLRADLGKASKHTKSWADKTRSLVNTSAKAFVGMGLAGAAAFTAIYVENAKMADALAKTSDTLGIMPEKLQALQHAGELTGAGVDTVNGSLQRMIRNVSEAATGTGEAVDTLKELNLNAEDLNKLSPDAQFKSIAAAMQTVEKHSDKVRLSIELFGRQGAQLVNTLDLGKDGLNAMEQEVNDLGIAMDRVSLAKIEIANDQFYRATQTTSAFGKALATETAPIIGALSEMFVDSAKEAGGFGQVASKVIHATATGFGYVADAGKGLQFLFLILRQGVAELGNEAVQGFLKIAQTAAKIDEYLGRDTSYLDNITLFANSMESTTTKLADELQRVITEPLPSAKIKSWLADVQTKFDVEAQSIAKNKKDNVGLAHLVLGDTAKVKEDSQQLVENARQNYQSINDAHTQATLNEAQLENIRFARQQQQMQKEVDLLREKGLLTKQIEDEFRQAQLEAEQTHTLNLQGIQAQKSEMNRGFWQEYADSVRETAHNTDQLWADTLSNFSQATSNEIMSSLEQWEGMGNFMENVAKSVAKTMIQSLIEIGVQRMTLWALEKLIGTSTATGYVAAVTGQAQASSIMAGINAFASTAAIPIVGPALAPAAMGAALAVTQPMAVAASTMAAGSLAGMAHNGIDAIPQEGTWLLDKNERVYTNESANKIDNMYNKVMNSSAGNGSGTTIDNINITVVSRRKGDILAEVSSVIPELASTIQYHIGRPR